MASVGAGESLRTGSSFTVSVRDEAGVRVYRRRASDDGEPFNTNPHVRQHAVQPRALDAFNLWKSRDG